MRPYVVVESLKNTNRNNPARTVLPIVVAAAICGGSGPQALKETDSPQPQAAETFGLRKRKPLSSSPSS